MLSHKAGKGHFYMKKHKSNFARKLHIFSPYLYQFPRTFYNIQSEQVLFVKTFTTIEMICLPILIKLLTDSFVFTPKNAKGSHNVQWYQL